MKETSFFTGIFHLFPLKDWQEISTEMGWNIHISYVGLFLAFERRVKEVCEVCGRTQGKQRLVPTEQFSPHLGPRQFNGELFRHVPGHPQTGKWKSVQGIRTPKWPWIIQVFWIDFINCSPPQNGQNDHLRWRFETPWIILEQTCTGFLQLTWHFGKSEWLAVWCLVIPNEVPI